MIMWQYILISLSAILFFSFVIVGVCTFGLLSCYSAYAPKWSEKWPSPGTLNIWSMVTLVSALLLIPVLLEQSNNNTWQFLGFLAPVSLILVGISPDYQTNKFSWWIHQIGAIATVIFISFYSILVPNLWWIILIIIAVAAIVSAITGFKKYWMFWAEMAMYLATYIILFIMV